MLNHQGTVYLETDRLILRGLNHEDTYSVFHNWTSDPEVSKFMRWNTHENLEVTKQWLKECEKNLKNNAYYNWGIILKSIEQPIGSIGAFINPLEPERYEIGYALSRKYWGHGYTTEALSGVMNYLTDTVDIKSYFCMHAKENPASGAVMGHVGFQYVKDGYYESFDKERRYECKMYYLDL